MQQCNPCRVLKCIPIECSGFHAAWRNGTFWMQWILCSMIECSGFHAAWLNAVDFMQHGPNHPDWIQCIPWSVNECEDSMHCGAMDPDCMQWSPCSEAQGITIECSGFHALWLNAVNSMQRGKMNPDWMQWIPWSVIECTVFHEVWSNGTLLNAVYFMQPDWMQWI